MANLRGLSSVGLRFSRTSLPTDPTHLFRGEPQSPINERLLQAKNYLADQDASRKPSGKWFVEASEISEYVQYIKNNKFSCDAELLKAVETILELHDEWGKIQKANAGEEDLCCGKKDVGSKISTRLISSEVKEVIEGEKEAMGMLSQTRTDACPFTVEREKDQQEFLQAMRKEAGVNREKVDEKSNLLWVESRAYQWARREPGLIPYWMHPTKGILRIAVLEENDRRFSGALVRTRSLSTKHDERDQQLRRLVRAQWISPKLMRKEMQINKLFGLLRAKGMTMATEPYPDNPEIAKVKWYLTYLLFDFMPSGPYDKRKKEHKLIEAEDKDCQKATEEFWKEFWRWMDNLMAQEEIQVEKFTPGPIHTIEESLIYYRRLPERMRLRESDIPQGVLEIQAVKEIHEEEVYDEKNNPLLFFKHMPQDLQDLLTKLRQKHSEAKGGESHLEGRFLAGFTQWYNKISKKHWSEWASAIQVEEQVVRQTAKGERGREEDETATKTRDPLEFVPKAERRGIRRAAIELALNLLATNQEQHRPRDRFRILELPPPYQPPPEEVPMSLALDPTQRKIELDPFNFTKKLIGYREEKDSDYRISRDCRNFKNPENLIPPPANYNGPFTVISVDDVQKAAKKRHFFLAQVYVRLTKAGESAPRPILQRMLLEIQNGIDMQNKQEHPLYDEKELSDGDIELLNEIAQPSWDESSSDLREVPEFTGLSDKEQLRLQEFEADLNRIPFIPLWSPFYLEASDILHNECSNEYCDEKFWRQKQYNCREKTQAGIQLQTLLHGEEREYGERSTCINDKRLNGSTGHIWTIDEARRYLTILHIANRIHFEDDAEDVAQQLVARVPLTGHPENIYVLSREEASRSPGVYRGSENRLEVRYNVDGDVGAPILQPNKFYHFLKIAFRLGRSISALLPILAGGNDDGQENHLADQWQAILDTVQNIMPTITKAHHYETKAPLVNHPHLSLQELVRDLDKITPELAKEYGVVVDDNLEDKQAAALLQMQILEEANNNWEARFPENEHVWDFATPKVEYFNKLSNSNQAMTKTRSRRFFNMRRFPLCYQSEATQNLIKSSGPVVEEKPKQNAERATRIQPDDDTGVEGGHPMEMYKGMNQPSLFPSGKAPYEQAFLNWRMKRDLKDVPEIQLKEAKILFNRKPKSPKEDLITDSRLPGLPENWKSINVLRGEQEAQGVEAAQIVIGCPYAALQERYHSQSEIDMLNRMEAYSKEQVRIAETRKAVEKHLRKSYNTQTVQVQTTAEKDLGLSRYVPWQGLAPSAQISAAPRTSSRRIKIEPPISRPVCAIRRLQPGGDPAGKRLESAAENLDKEKTSADDHRPDNSQPFQNTRSKSQSPTKRLSTSSQQSRSPRKKARFVTGVTESDSSG
ncbi:hypothetical protein BGZ60DRAFT_564015 [Tricladium varicosporioides]|nr:hypothetical protein BGZ60DRAFT_564015 [Hymenoscyphus varicosporioides]